MKSYLPLIPALVMLRAGTTTGFSVFHYMSKAQLADRRIRVLPPCIQRPVKLSLAAQKAFSTNSSIKDKKSKGILLVWVHLLSIFVAGNYFRSTLWPPHLLGIRPAVWALVHGLSAMAFAGGVLTTTILEWTLPNMGQNRDISSTLLDWLWNIESKMVLPGVTGSMISGVVQAHQTYGTLRHAPIHVKSALHLMLLFGIWWAWTDRRSQADVRAAGGSFDATKVGTCRRLYNVVSCGFLVSIYGVMILKPGFS
jgi:hypothetical protein